MRGCSLALKSGEFYQIVPGARTAVNRRKGTWAVTFGTGRGGYLVAGFRLSASGSRIPKFDARGLGAGWERQPASRRVFFQPGAPVMHRRGVLKMYFPAMKISSPLRNWEKSSGRDLAAGSEGETPSRQPPGGDAGAPSHSPVVGTPVLDRFLDVVARKLFVEGALGELGNFRV